MNEAKQMQNLDKMLDFLSKRKASSKKLRDLVAQFMKDNPLIREKARIYMQPINDLHNDSVFSIQTTLISTKNRIMRELDKVELTLDEEKRSNPRKEYDELNDLLGEISKRSFASKYVYSRTIGFIQGSAIVRTMILEEFGSVSQFSMASLPNIKQTLTEIKQKIREKFS